ncbi:DNA-binding protein [Clostridium sporogenes]|nr:DNA-binding protein [Clostridium sporogenes]
MAISKNNTRIKITIPKEINEQLKLKASKEQRSVSNYVYKLIIKDLENK